MAEKTTESNVWIADAEGTKALVVSAEAWRPRGWVAADAPVAGDFVWLENEETGGKQRFTQEVVEQWGALGWKPTAPPEPVDLTRDPSLTDAAVQPPAAKKATTKSATSGETGKE